MLRKIYADFCRLRDLRDAGKEAPKYTEERAFELSVKPMVQASKLPLSDEDIKAVAINYAAHVAAGIYDVTKYDCAEDFFNCVRAILAIRQPAPAANVAAQSDLCQECQGFGEVKSGDRTCRACRPQTAAAPLAAKPFMYAIMEPGGAPYMDECCVAMNPEDLHATLNSLNDSPDTGYLVVPVFLACQRAVAEDDAQNAERWQFMVEVSAGPPAINVYAAALNQQHFVLNETPETRKAAFIAAVDAARQKMAAPESPKEMHHGPA